MRNVKCTWLYGPTRVGKSWEAVRLLGGDLKQIYIKDAKTKFWENYEQQSKVLIDELPIESATWILNYLKRWSDKLPCIIEIKGYSAFLNATEVIVTC